MARHGTVTIRELGTTLAVLSLYVLVLLAPLHQTAGLQRDLAALGYETLNAWSVCASLEDDGTGNPGAAPVLKCPAAEISKTGFAAALPPDLPAVTADAGAPATSAPRSAPHAWRLPQHVGQSRAPPR